MQYNFLRFILFPIFSEESQVDKLLLPRLKETFKKKKNASLWYS